MTIFSLVIAVLGFVRPDGIVAPENVDVRVDSNGVVEVRAPEGVDEVSLLWRRSLSGDTRVLRDDWERTYGKAGWTTVDECVGSAWYLMVEHDGAYDGWGVAVQPNAFAWWSVSEKGIALTLDLRAGGRPVRPGNRVIEAARLVMREGQPGERPYVAGREFCRMMCPDPRLPKEPVYGYNDWYCAYGKNTATNFLADASFVMGLAEGLANRPYVVMDDGWQKNSPPVVRCLNEGASGWGPWNEAGEAFGMKMRPFAEAVAALGAKPGLWYRPFRAWAEIPDCLRLKADRRFFDPSCSEVKAMIAADIRRFRDWGMKLVKIDYLTMDVAGGASYADCVGARLVPSGHQWRDESRTTVEVLKDLYRTMREAAGDDMVIIGCNALNHLAAGLFELQRTGGDTSGWKWSQTREMGVNTLASRSIQNGTFFAVDADCVGLAQAGAVPWEKNRQWLELVSRSGTPLFVSWQKGLATAEVQSALRQAFSIASRARETAEPLDWQKTGLPRNWRFADGEATFDWGFVEKELPDFRRELMCDEEQPDAPESFVLEDRYGLTGVLASVHTNLDLLLGRSGRRLVLCRGKVEGRESYCVDVASDRVMLTAEDDEGMRRAVYYFSDRVYARDLKSATRRPWLKNRISRCYFGPIKRPPFNHDELTDDVDYYPPAYLNRLAHEGVNGLWLTVSFADLASTPYRPVSPSRERRLAKLRRTVERCANYGIKTWLFFIEPALLPGDDPIFAKHPEIRRPLDDGDMSRCTLCGAHPVVRRYLECAAKSIFADVPGLAGAIAITHGERVTSCLWDADPTGANPLCRCPDCAKLAPWQVSLNLIEPLSAGVKAANPDAELISWFYHPEPSNVRGEWVTDCVRHLPDGVTFQYNFESGAEIEQLGKIRRGGDYWLSFVGPSKPFADVAQAARTAHRPLSAKIQVGCSHEVATLPYVPAPGLLYRKYREMRRLGVSSVMQCWYFGNYPGTMNAAAGELAFEDFSDDEESFLRRLALPQWREKADAVAAAWESATRGYMEYPLSNQMQYYGPVHAGVTWPLLPDVGMAGLPRSWKPQDMPSGDLIGECLENHSAEEAVALLDRGLALMRGDGAEDPLQKLERLVSVRDWSSYREIILMKALRIQFESARNIIEFYRLRAEAIVASRVRAAFDVAIACADRMRMLIARERELGRQMSRLAFADSRLGFHSESEDYRFDARKIQQRTDGLAWSERRLEEIVCCLRERKPWPESKHELNAPRWTGCRSDASGGLVLEGPVPAPNSTNAVTVYLYDACGVSFLRKYDVPNVKGRFSLCVPSSEWSDDPVKRPGWLMLDQGSDFWSFDGVRWPADPEFRNRALKDLRLNLWGIESDRFGRLMFSEVQ